MESKRYWGTLNLKEEKVVQLNKENEAVRIFPDVAVDDYA